ncbi:MAG TPA: hypothetical protein VMM93_09695 [Vicinamibacterales bacterium]|nr:hypothetical protein [Vicinamibacterales bacterium]
MTTGQKITLGGATILLLGALYYVLDDHEERPPIVVEDGSVTLTAQKGRSQWRQHGADRRYEQHHPGGRDVDGFSAESGGCTVSGDSIVITLSDGSTITVSMHRSFPWIKDHTDVTVPDGVATTIENLVRLRVSVDATPRSFASGSTSCDVVGERIDIVQLH